MAMTSPSATTLATELDYFLGAYVSNLPLNVSLKEVKCPHSTSTFYLSLTAVAPLDSLSTGSYERPSAYVCWRPDRSPGAKDLHFLGFQCSEFALPVRANDVGLQFDFFSRPGFIRPHSVLPLLIMSGTTSRCAMLAPVQTFHEQVLAIVDVEDNRRELHWGWSGDLKKVPSGFVTKLAVILGSSPRELIATWGMLVRKHALQQEKLVNRRGRYADASVGKLSMWTDNGASYWYRTEKGMDLPSTLEAAIIQLDKLEVPVATVELDSWFYRHQITRPVADVGYLNVVPPTGMLRWEPREDVLGKGGIKDLRRRLGNRPLILHSRHISSESDYQKDPSLDGENWWIDNDRAHPQGPALFRRWMQQAADWGATTYEQDWLVEVWLGVRQLREEPGRIETWQRQLDSAAKEHNVNLIWCMATAADMAQAASLEQIIALRSCDDYRYAKDPSILWRWHLTVSCLLRSLGLFPFKDVFMSHCNSYGMPDIEGDPHAALEACLSALSAGPVGIGDRVGRTNPDLVKKTCRSDGVLIKPDLPLAALDRSIRNPSDLLWAETKSGPWRYILAIRTGIKSENLESHSVPLTESLELGLERPVLAFDWISKTANVQPSVTASLLLHEWILWVVCPIASSKFEKCAIALIGDANAFATMGDRRFRVESHSISERGISFDVLGVHDERVEVSYWASTTGIMTQEVVIPSKGWCHCTLSIADGKAIFQTH